MPPETETRLQYLEARIALQNAFFAYAASLDDMSDMNALLASFREDAVFDLTGLNLPRFQGHAGIRGFFSEGFSEVTHLAHLVTNFRVLHLENDKADCCANVLVTWKDRSGAEGTAYLQTATTYVRMEGAWRISMLLDRYLMPPRIISGPTS